MSYLSPEVIVAAQEHARREYPKESCGLVVNGVYEPAFNYALDPLKDFVIADEVYLAAVPRGLQAVLHSHPDGPMYPTRTDMQQQIATGVPWGIIALDDERVSEPIMWGDALPIVPLIGREFIHGVSDCYSIIRDGYRMGREAFAAQGMNEWPFDPIVLPEVPRDDEWWASGEDLYQDHFEKFGFREVSRFDVKPGDVFLMKLRSDKLNHGGIYIGGDLIVHHLPGRLSRREPAGIWARNVDIWIRHEAGFA